MSIQHNTVYDHPEDGPIYVTGGAFQIDNRVSNYWTWRCINEDGTLGEQGSGYGGDWPVIETAEVITTVNLNR